MTSEQILTDLKTMGNENIRRIYINQGAPESQYGVKIEDLKKIQKKIRKDYQLSKDLFDSGIPDAQYLAGLIADETKMTKKDLQHWAEMATWHMLSEYTVPWIAAESAHGWELAQSWINSGKENLQSTGWSTLASLVSIKADEDLEIPVIKKLLHRVEKEIGKAPNRGKYAMNCFIISVGGYVKELSAEAISVGKSIGQVTVDMSGTACKVPYSPDYIKKMLDRGVKKKKMARC